MLIGISLAVAIVGIFTSTVETVEEEGKPKVRRVTRWGYLVAALLVVSALANGLNSYVTASDQKKKDQENRRALSQQRLLALASLGSAYTLAHNPFVVASFAHNYDMADQPEKYAAFYENHREFPGAGFPVRGYLLTLEPTEERRFYFAGGKIADAEESFGAANALEYDMEETPFDVNHIWSIPGYRTLDELLFDFKSGSPIGTLTFWRTAGNFTSNEVVRLQNAINNELDNLHVRCFLGKKNHTLGRVHIEIPVRAEQPEQEAGKVSFTLTAEDPVVDSIAFTPL